MKQIILILILFSSLHLSHNATAQYKRVSVIGDSGAKHSFDKNEVTVDYVGPWTPTFARLWYHCDVGSYIIGYRLAFFFNIFTPTSFTFSYAQPVRHIRIYIIHLREDDIVSFDINSSPYPITAANFSPFVNNCGIDTAVIQGGNLTGPPGWSKYSSPGTGARIQFHDPAGINSNTLSFLGVIDPFGFSGATFSVYFGQIMASSNGPVCPGDSLQLWGDTTITEPGTFSWSGPNGFVSKQQNPILTNLSPKDTGIYTLTYVNNGTDTFTDTTHVRLKPGPMIPVITADSPICAGNTIHLSPLTTPGATYSWTGPHGFTASTPSITIPNVQQPNEGLYKVVASQYNCTPSAKKEIRVNYPVTNSVTEIICSNANYEFNGRELNQAGVHIDTFTAENGCDSMVKLNLVVLPAPEVRIGIEDPGPYCMRDSLHVRAEGNAAGYFWQQEDSRYIDTQRRITVLLPRLSNNIRLSGISDNDCVNKDSVTITADGCCELFIPNAFSPNNDGLNDEFISRSNGYFSKFHMNVFNRWGQRIFQTTDISKGWDGYYFDKPADIGTYYYHIIADCLEGKELNKKGEVVLIR